MSADCQHNRLEAESVGCHVTDGNPNRWAGYGVRVRVRCADCHAPFRFKWVFETEPDRERQGGEWLEARLIAGTPKRLQRKTASVAASTGELEVTEPGEGTLARPEIASAADETRELPIHILSWWINPENATVTYLVQRGDVEKQVRLTVEEVNEARGPAALLALIDKRERAA